MKHSNKIYTYIILIFIFFVLTIQSNALAEYEVYETYPENVPVETFYSEQNTLPSRSRKGKISLAVSGYGNLFKLEDVRKANDEIKDESNGAIMFGELDNILASQALELCIGISEGFVIGVGFESFDCQESYSNLIWVSDGSSTYITTCDTEEKISYEAPYLIFYSYLDNGGDIRSYIGGAVRFYQVKDVRDITFGDDMIEDLHVAGEGSQVGGDLFFGIEVESTYPLTLFGQVGYRFAKVEEITITESNSSDLPVGDTLLNSDDSNYTIDLSGGYACGGLRLYF